MLPLILDPRRMPVLLAGDGPALRKRLALLDEAGADVSVYAPHPDEALRALAGARLRGRLPQDYEIAAHRLLFLAGLEQATAARLAAARARRVLVNTEDVLPLCDFHVPAQVRRGDLLLTVSTGGQSPGLAAALRAWLAERFGADWSGRLSEAARLRQSLRNSGAAPAHVARETNELIRRRHWLRDAVSVPGSAL